MRWLFSLAILVVVLATPSSVFADKSYGYPTLGRMPRDPDIIKNQGGTAHFDRWRMTVAPETFNYDVYFRNGCWHKSLPMRIGRYWQISHICEFWPRPFSTANSAPAVAKKSWVITYKYDDVDLLILGNLSFPEDSLKLVHSDDHGQSWTMLRSSVVDPVNNTVSAITDKGGGYMVMGGFVPPTTFYNYKAVKGVSTVRGEEESLSSRFLAAFEYVFILIGRVI